MNNEEIIQLVMGIDWSKSKQQLRKDIKGMQKSLQGELGSLISVKAGIVPQISDSDFTAIKSKFIGLNKEINMVSSEMAKIQISAGVSENGEQLAKVIAHYTSETGDAVRATATFNVETQQLIGNINESRTSLNLTSTQFEHYKVEIDKIKQSMESTNRVIKDFGGSAHHTKANELIDDMHNIGITSDMTEKQIKEQIVALKTLKTQMSMVSAEAKSQGKNSLSFINMVKNAFRAFSIWSAVTVAWYGFIRAVKGGIVSIIDLDTAMTDFNKVANLTTLQLEEVKDAAFDMGVQFGQTGTTVINTLAEFKRAGYDVADSMELATTSMVLMNVGEVDLKETTDVLISSLENYNLTARDSMEVADKLNEVSNKTSTTVQGLANGLQRSAGTLSQTGTSLDENLGLLVAGFTTLRNMEKVSTGLITITTRLKGVKDGEEEFLELTPKMEAKFKELGLTLLDTNGEFKSTYDILQDLSKVYPELNSLQQAEINYLVAGTRQAPVLTAMLNDFALAEKAVGVSMNSSGSAMKENALQMQSIAKKVEVMKSAWIKFWSVAIEKDVIKDIVDGLTNLADGLTSMLEDSEKGFKALNAVMIVTIGLFISLRGEAMLALGASLGSLIKAVVRHMALLVTSGTSLIGVIKAIGLAIKASFGFWGLLIGAIVVGLFNIIKHNKEVAESNERLVKKYSDLNDMVKTTTQAMEDYNKTLNPSDLEAYSQSVDALRAHLEDLKSEAGYIDITKRIQETEDSILNVKKSMSTTVDPVMLDRYRESLDQLRERLKKYQLQIYNVTKAEKELADNKLLLAEHNKWTEYTANMARLHNITIGYQGDIESLLSTSEQLAKAIEDNNTATVEYADTLSTIGDLKDTINDGNKVEIADLVDLAIKYPTLADEIVNMNSSKEAGLEVAKKIYALENIAYTEQLAHNRKMLEDEQLKLNAKRELLKAYEDELKLNAFATIMGDKESFADYQSLLIKISEIGNKIAAIDLTSSIVKSVKFADLGGSKKDSTTKTKEKEEYISKQTALNKLLLEEETIENKISIGTKNMLQTQIDKIAQIKKELERLNNLDREKLATLTAGTEAYDDLYDTISGRSNDWYGWEAKRQDVLEAQKEELIEQRRALQSIADLTSSMESDLEAVDKYGESITEELKDQLDVLEKQKEAITDKYEIEIDKAQEAIDLQKTSNEADADALELQEKILAVQKAQVELENVSKEKNTKVYENGKWTWQANPEALRKANEAVTSAIADRDATILEQSKNAEMARLEAIKTDLEKKRDLELKDLEAKNKFITEKLDTLSSIESDSYFVRLNAYKQFVIDFNAESAKLNYGSSVTTSKAPAMATSEKDVIAAMSKNAATWRTEVAAGADKKTDSYLKDLVQANEDMAAGAGMTKNKETGTWYTSSGVKAFDKGGLMDYTGTAQIHGSITRPELALNNQQAGYLYNMLKNGANSFNSMNKSAVLNGGSNSGITIGNLNISAQNGDTLSSLIKDAKNMVRNGFRG